MNSKWGRKNLLIIIISLIGAYITFPVFFERSLLTITDHSQNWFSLDPSWSLSITEVFKKRMMWGTEFVLTYGPFGFLTSRLLLGINKYYLIGFDIFLAANFFLFFYYSLIRSTSKGQVLALIVACLICLPIYFGSGTSILLLVIQLFWMVEYLTWQKAGSLIAAILISIVLLFMKFNTGFISALLLFVVIVYTFVTQPNTRKILSLSLLVYFLIFIGLARFFNVNVLPYFKTGFMMVEGYGDLMYLDQGKNAELFSAIFCLISCFCLLIFSLIKQTTKHHLTFMILILFAIPSYVLYKQGFTRADEQHIHEFYFYYPLLILAFPQFSDQHLHPGIRYMIFVPVCICCFFALNPKQGLLKTISNRLIKYNYIKSFMAAGPATGNILDPAKNQLPLASKNRIGNAKIDAYPWNIIELYENKLKISTRPIMQSYTAYTKQLQLLNTSFYDSNLAPDYVLYDYASIDNRYPLCDEPLLNLRLFNNYALCDTLHSYGRFKLLLKKNKINNISLVPTKTYELDINSKIIPMRSTYYEIIVKKTIKGRLQSLLFKPPQLLLQIMNGHKQLFEYHTSINLLESGFFSNVIYHTTSDVLKMYTKEEFDANNTILFYGIRVLDAGCFEEKITVKEYDITR